MKTFFIFIALTFSSIYAAFAQNCEAKCLSGNCENGFGKYQWDNCITYEGTFKDYKQNGQGKYDYKNGDFYEGGFTSGSRNGYGKYTWSDGTRHEGNWVNDVMNGQGTIYYSSGVKYIGECYNSNREGKGVNYYTDGSVYDGNWKNNNRHGFGKQTWKGGTRYEGNWENDVMKGQGTIYYSNGEKYVGECYDSKREGKGIHYNANGTVYHDGYWKNNEKSDAGTTTYTDDYDEDYDDWDWLYEDDYEEVKTEETKKENLRGETTQGNSSGNFCTDYKAVLAEAGNQFKNSQGSIRSEEGELIKTQIYNTTISIAGAEDCYIQSLLGLNYYASFGEYSLLSDAENKFNEIKEKIKNCISDRILQDENPKDNKVKRFSITKKYADGQELYGDELFILKTDNGKYSVKLYASTNTWGTRVYVINNAAGSGDASFDSNLKKIMESSRSKFVSVLGEKHENNSLFGSSTTYDVNASLPGIFDLNYATGSFSFSDDIVGTKYQGTDATAAKQAYDNLCEKVRKSLGSNYVYTSYASNEGNSYYQTFALKSEIKNDKTPIVKISYYKSSYGSDVDVKIYFSYKGFGSLL